MNQNEPVAGVATTLSADNLMDASEKLQGRFRWVAGATVVTIYILILVGGIVRATGSGMGCPDWPMCFGQWIPPTSEAQLPADYQQIYADRGYAETTFNLRKTWTEYLNRLLGVFTGFWIFLTLLASIPYRKYDKVVFNASLAGFILVGFQGWLGSRVVASNLAPGMITVHMLVAQLIVGILIYALVRSQKRRLTQSSAVQLPGLVLLLLCIAMIASFAQILVGSQVREAVDLIARASSYENRHLWIENLPAVFSFHRLFAYPTVAVSVVFAILAFRQEGGAPGFKVYSGILLFLVIGTLVLGLSLDQMHVPAYAQPLHLWFASMIFGAQFYLYMLNRYVPRALGSSDASS